MQTYLEDAPFLGPLVLVGGGEWQEGCDFDADLVTRAKLNSKNTLSPGSDSSSVKVLILPTAAAYQNPVAAIKNASLWFDKLGVETEECMLLNRDDAFSQPLLDKIQSSKFIYIAGGSPLHLRSALKSSPAFEAIMHAWQSGAILAGSSAGAMVLTDPMIDPRGGAFSVGLGAVENIVIYPHFAGSMDAKLQRTISLAPRNCVVVALPEQTAIIREPEGAWHVEGKNADAVSIYLSSHLIGIGDLESLIT